MFGPNGLVDYNDGSHGTLFYAFDERDDVIGNRSIFGNLARCAAVHTPPAPDRCSAAHWSWQTAGHGCHGALTPKFVQPKDCSAVRFSRHL